MTIAKYFLIAAFALSSIALRAADAPKPTPAPALTVAKPTLSVKDGVVTLAGGEPDGLIMYTLDKSDPSAKSAPYLAPIDLPFGGLVRARAFSKDRKNKSDLVEQKIDSIKGDEKGPPTSVIPVTQCREWPGYDWVTRHNAILAEVKKRNPTVLFIGDSITHFFGGEPHDKGGSGKGVWEKFYAPRNPVNLGYGWDRTENVLWRVTVGHELDNCAPKAVVMMIGTNNLGLNTAPDIALGITKICEAIHTKLPETKILLLAIFPRGEKPDVKPDGARHKIAEINAIIAKLDGQNNITYLDFGAKFLNDAGILAKDIMPDALHPNEKGYQIWAENMEPTLKKLLGE